MSKTRINVISWSGLLFTVQCIVSGPVLAQSADSTGSSMFVLPTTISNTTADEIIRDDGAFSVSIITPTLPDIWQRVRQGFRLIDYDHKRTIAEMRWYKENQGYIDRTLTRASPYLHLVLEEVSRRGMPHEIALLPIVESAYQPYAYSHGRAAGMWQFIPSTGRIYGLKQNWWYDGRRDVVASTNAALDYLQYLNKKFNGDWLHALAAYNSGSGTVSKAIKRNKSLGKPTDFWSLKLPRETRAYVPKLLAVSALFAEPERYNISLISIPDIPYLTTVDIGSQIDLALAADMAGLPLDDLYKLNPAFNRWATDPDGPYQLLLPISKAEEFKKNLAELPAGDRIKWTRHRIREGQTLSHIAKKYRTTVDLLRQVNNLKDSQIRAGKSLTIPVATKNLSAYKFTTEQRVQAIQNSTRKGKKITHTVAKGDTLWDIARKYKVSVAKLAKWNAMAPRDVLQSGQRLVVWTKPTKSTISNFTASPPISGVTQRINYTVKSGDSLARISQKFNVSIANLKRWNSLHKQKYLQPGQKLTLLVDVTRLADNI